MTQAERLDLIWQAATYLQMAREQRYSEHRAEWRTAARDIFKRVGMYWEPGNERQ